jgi:hypothetical protein
MQRDMGGGRTAYVLSLPRSAERPPVVDIFEPTVPDSVVTVAEQEAFFEEWRKSPLVE